MESGIDGHFVTRFSLPCTRLHDWRTWPLQDGVDLDERIQCLVDLQRLQTRGCAGELRRGGRGRIHEEYGEFL